MPLSDRSPETITVGQPTETTNAVKEQARKLAAAVDEALAEKTFHRDDTPLPLVGTAPPVIQPGRAPMSQGAVDASTMMLSGGVATVLIGGTASLLMVASGHADPVVCGIVCGAPAVLVLALSQLVKRAKGVLPEEHHHHYAGPVTQDSRQISTKTTGVFAKTRNQTAR